MYKCVLPINPQGKKAHKSDFFSLALSYLLVDRNLLKPSKESNVQTSDDLIKYTLHMDRSKSRILLYPYYVVPRSIDNITQTLKFPTILSTLEQTFLINSTNEERNVVRCLPAVLSFEKYEDNTLVGSAIVPIVIYPSGLIGLIDMVDDMTTYAPHLEIYESHDELMAVINSNDLRISSLHLFCNAARTNRIVVQRRATDSIAAAYFAVTNKKEKDATKNQSGTD